MASYKRRCSLANSSFATDVQILAKFVLRTLQITLPADQITFDLAAFAVTHNGGVTCELVFGIFDLTLNAHQLFFPRGKLGFHLADRRFSLRRLFHELDGIDEAHFDLGQRQRRQAQTEYGQGFDEVMHIRYISVVLND